MVDNLKDVNMVDRERVQLIKSPFVLEDVVDDVAGAVAIACRTNDITLTWDRPVRPFPKALGDRDYVQKVLHNILQNAVKYTRAHGAIEITVQETDRSSPDGDVVGDFLQVTVTDSGIGIPSDERPMMFSRFYRAQNVSQFEIEGAGVGLYLAKRFVELHGGQIWLTSKEGKGTTVSFTIPTVTNKDVVHPI
jgi:signal transduction histidine kinase